MPAEACLQGSPPHTHTHASTPSCSEMSQGWPAAPRGLGAQAARHTHGPTLSWGAKRWRWPARRVQWEVEAAGLWHQDLDFRTLVGVEGLSRKLSNRMSLSMCSARGSCSWS